MNTVEYLSPDLVRLAFVMGMVFSVVVYEKSHITTGSIVIPGFFGIHVFEPMTIITCLLNAVVCYALVHQVAPRFWLMSNKSKFNGLIILSVVIQLACQLLTQIQSPVAFAGDLMAGLGFVVPGLLAHDMARNGASRTIANSASISAGVGAIVFALVSLKPELSLGTPPLPLPLNFDLVLLLTLSTLGSVLLKLLTNLRSGGYVTPAYFVFFIVAPKLLVLIVAVALATHVLARQFLIHKLIIFGRRKFATMLLVGSMLQWFCLSSLHHVGIHIPFGNDSTFAGIVILLPGLIANEIQRTQLKNVGTGLTLVFYFTYSATALLYEIHSFARPLKLVAWSSLLLGATCVLTILNHIGNGRKIHPENLVEQRAST